MAKYDKHELLVLAGAIYAFVAYLVAFALEVVFVMDLAKRNIEIFSSSPSMFEIPQQQQSQQQQPQLVSTRPLSADSAPPLQLDASQQQQLAILYEAMQSMRSQVTVACLALSILYFVIFVGSLLLVVALIIRSSMLLLAWMCVMATLSVPELAIVLYVSVQGWGLASRNGQTELGMYLLRLLLNVIFIYLVHKLWRHWNYEKNFFILKKSSRFTGYDSPYFVGDSLSTTINPIFSSQTLANLDRYDQIRCSQGASGATSTTANNHNRSGAEFSTPGALAPSGWCTGDSPLGCSYNNNNSYMAGNNTAKTSLYSSSGCDYIANPPRGRSPQLQNLRDLRIFTKLTRPDTGGSIQLNSLTCGGNGASRQQKQLASADVARRFRTRTVDAITPQQQQQLLSRQRQFDHSECSVLSIDDLTDCELDLDYRTLTNQRHAQQQHLEAKHLATPGAQRKLSRQQRALASSKVYDMSLFGGQPQQDGSIGSHHDINNNTRDINNNSRASSGQAKFSYSTQSLDRRNLRDLDYLASEQVILRPLDHRPFDYLKRPGSTSNVNGIE